ncbi:uncharacterized protein LOC143026009 [Oratosquilla oratoria]|uniref:uncharacterized protein LOC143026009 n=1 Tax=Oratosquilla oratoria TaxID=337810 RepID=UPI003F771A7B
MPSHVLELSAPQGSQEKRKDNVLRRKVTDHLEYRFLAWDMQHLGAVGETVLHLCVLNATSVHSDLAKRLIRHFPSLINDIYMSDEYYGESVLHIAIVNEDPAMVKFLLDNGANYHERCLGNFMCPEDQKASRQDSLEHEWVDLCQQTNYEGYVYWGEYPMSFAACLGQEECYRLILAKGADPDNQDSNGNTVAHMMVIYEKLEMFDMVYELGGAINIRNRQGLIPLTLAARLARRDIFFHILNIDREIYWQIGNITCAAYPLEDLDTINYRTGETQKKSALNLITYGEKEAHLDLMEGPIVDLLKVKWSTFVKFRFYQLFFVFLTYFLISMGAYVLRPTPCVSSPVAGSKGSPTPSVMVLPALGITCVNVSVMLSPKVSISDPSITTVESAPLTHTAGDSFLPNTSRAGISSLRAALSQLGSPLISEVTSDVTVNPQEELLELGSDGFPVPEAALMMEGDGEELTSVVTSQPLETVTVQYIVEGEEIAVTVATTLNEMLDTTTPSLTGLEAPLAFTCYNNTHDITLVGRNRTFVVTAIEKRIRAHKLPASAPAVGLYGSTLANATNPCHCALWRVPPFKNSTEPYVGGTPMTELMFYIRVVCEGMTVVGSIAYIVGAARECRFQGIQMFVENLSTVPSRVLFLLACVLVLVMVVLRMTCSNTAEDIVAVIVMLCTAPYFLFFCRGFKTVGPFVTMIYTMLVGDLLRFVTIYLVFVLGFSQAYYTIFRSHGKLMGKSQCQANPMPSPAESVMAMFIMSLNNFGDVYDSLECTDHEISGKILFVIFMAIVTILLINLLIAMMGNTYQRIAETKNEWQRQNSVVCTVGETSELTADDAFLAAVLMYSQRGVY